MNWGLCFRIAPTNRELEIHEIFTNNIYWVNPNSNLGHETLISTRLGEFLAANKQLQLFMFMFTSTKRNEERKRKGEGEIDRSIWRSPNFQKWHKQMPLISRRKHNVIFKAPQNETKRTAPTPTNWGWEWKCQKRRSRDTQTLRKHQQQLQLQQQQQQHMKINKTYTKRTVAGSPIGNPWKRVITALDSRPPTL